MTKLNLIFLFLVFCILEVSSSQTNTPYKVVCYLGSWANYRRGDGKFFIEDIDPTLCTHVIYGFAKLHDDKIAAYDTYLDLKENWGLGAFDRFNGLKKLNPSLKTLIAIGGWNEGSIKYSQMASRSASRKTFVDSCVQFLGQHKFDGLDLDWEYPANRGGKPEDKKNFVSLIKELREAFEPYGYLLSAAVSAGENTIESAYDIPALGKYLDFINLMAYDFHGGWEKFTGHNAPLYAASKDTELNKKLTVDYAVRYWLSKGAPANKLILGMAFYGRGFSLSNPKNSSLNVPVDGNSMAGEYTMQPGMLGYNEICKMLKNQKGWSIIFDSNLQAPYAVKDKQWIGYDDDKSIRLKVQYLQTMKLGGGMVWSLETDDFRGQCHGQKYPLLRVINEALNDGKIPTLPELDNRINDISSPHPYSSSSTTTKSTAEDTPEPNDLMPCPYSDYFRHPQNCKLFYFCKPKSSSVGENLYYMFRCGEGTIFSQKLRVCTFPSSVPECS